MRSLQVFCSFVFVAALAGFCPAQGGFGGGLGRNQGRENARIQNIDEQIGGYLNGDEIKNILTPGEYSEWKLSLKAGQVVIAEARSDAFDPALEIVSGTKSLASNDDRYPGDQRPLLLWRCEKDGDYSMRVRCFLNKAGGEFFLRYKIYDSVDLEPGNMKDTSFDNASQILLRIPMKAGQIEQIVQERPNGSFGDLEFEKTIAPDGLPDIRLTEPINAAIPNAIMAAVDGDYYELAYHNDHKIRVGLREIQPKKLAEGNGRFEDKEATDTPSLWTISVKKGDLLEVAVPDLNLNAVLAIAEKPDISKFDVSKPETNPFFPNEDKGQKPPVFDLLPARDRDSREAILLAERDTTLWISTNGAGKKDLQYTLSVKQAADTFEPDSQKKGQLKIGNTDYWAFNAKIGDVMTLSTSAKDFSERAVTKDPDMNVLASMTADVDQNAMKWNLVATKNGRYLVQLSSYGNGGGGDYNLARTVFPARSFALGSPASGELKMNGTVQAWKLDVSPAEPLIIHLQSSNWSYPLAIHDQNGREVNLAWTDVDATNKYAIIKVDQPTSLLLILTPDGKNAQYTFEVNRLLGAPSKKG